MVRRLVGSNSSDQSGVCEISEVVSQIPVVIPVAGDSDDEHLDVTQVNLHGLGRSVGIHAATIKLTFAVTEDRQVDRRPRTAGWDIVRNSDKRVEILVLAVQIVEYDGIGGEAETF